jgi:hypothetical protein
LVNLGNVSSIDLTNNNFAPLSNLPANLCPRCQRFTNKCGVFGCSTCRDGQLLGCQNPNKVNERPGCNLPAPEILVDNCFYNFG